MFGPEFIWVLAGLVAVAAGAPAHAADQAVLRDGRTFRGQFTIAQGQQHFRPSDGSPELPGHDIAFVRLPGAETPPSHIAAPFRAQLNGREHLSGELLELGERELRFRSSVAGGFRLARSEVMSIGHLPGFVTLVHDAFERDLRLWRIAGKPYPGLSTAEHESGQKSLCLDMPGQSAELSAPAGINRGRVEISVFFPTSQGGGRWKLEAQFARKPGPEVTVAQITGGPDRCDAGIAGIGQGRAKSPPGWHRVVLTFGERTVHFFLDQGVVWSARLPRDLGELQAVRLKNIWSADHSLGVYVDDFRLAAAVERLPRPPVVPARDEAWLLAGDQLFAMLVRADSHEVEFTGAYGKRMLSWAGLRSVYLRRAIADKSTDTKHFAVELRSGLSLDVDRLEGAIERLDDCRLILHHDRLGRLTLDRGHIARVILPVQAGSGDGGGR